MGCLAMPIQAAALLLVLWRARLSSAEDWPRFAAAILLAFIVTGKVLSPQYLIWILPFLAVMEGATGRRTRAIFLAGCLVTAFVFPWAQIRDDEAASSGVGVAQREERIAFAVARGAPSHLSLKERREEKARSGGVTRFEHLRSRLG